MRRAVLILGLIIAAGLGLLWVTGGFAALERSVEAAQREMQGTLAGAVRALRAGNPGALAALMAACFSYGFIHAAGPGHGKVLIAGYGVGRRVPLLRLSALAIASSLAQAGVAIALVLAGITALGWTREQMVGVTDDIMTPISYGAILLLGLWLVWRGAARLRRQALVGHEHDDHAHDHDHVHDEHCGHAHGPSLEQAAGVTGFRDALGLIAGIAIRPCTGALFLLILTWQMGIFASGVAGVLAMGIGTATVTVGVAVMAVWAREGALASLPGARIAQALPVMELAAGLVVALVAGQLLLRSL
jgi:nickel/cobalt transporter (NicO) family protein